MAIFYLSEDLDTKYKLDPSSVLLFSIEEPPGFPSGEEEWLVDYTPWGCRPS